MLCMPMLACGQVTYHHSVGVSYIAFDSPSGTAGFPAISYMPRFNLYRFHEKVVVSVSVPMSLGFGGNFSSSQSESFLFGEIPISADLNLGHAARKGTDANIGGFIGAGYGINSFNYRYANSNGSSITLSEIRGPYAHTGLRFASRIGGSLTFSVYMIKGQSTVNIFGGRILYNIPSRR